MDVVANPYIYYLAQVIGSIKLLTGGCSLLCFISALWSLTSIIDIKKVMEYNGFEHDARYLKVCSYKREASAVGVA